MVGVVERLPVVLITTHEHQQVRAEADQILLRPEIVVPQAKGLRGGTLADQNSHALDRCVVGHQGQLGAGDQRDMVLEFVRRQPCRSRRFLRKSRLRTGRKN